MKKYLVFKDVLANIMHEEDLRTNWEETIGLKVKLQITHKDPIISIFEVIDERKALKYYNHSDVEVMNLTQLNKFLVKALKDYPEYTLTDTTALQIDLQLSNKKIEGYNKDKPLTDQENLKVLYEAGMGGIVKKPRPKIE